MQPVRTAARLSRRGRIAAAALIAAAAAALVVSVVASGRDAPAPRAHARAAGPPVTLIGGKALQSARCRQWRRATSHQRDAVVATLAGVVGGPTPYGRASTLPAEVAQQLFDRTCRRPYARGFLLYELYTRAAAFYSTPRRNL